MAERRTQVVCVVDDDESLRRSVKNLLSSVGFRVETFASSSPLIGRTPGVLCSICGWPG